MIEPFLADFFTRAFTPWFLDVIAFFVGAQRIQPDKDPVFILALELRLTVDGPGQIPVIPAVLDRYNTAGSDFSRARITLADLPDVVDDFFIGSGNSCTPPVCSIGIRAEVIWISVFAVLGLLGNVLPPIPGFTGSVFDLGKIRSMGLVSVAACIGAAAVGNEDKIVFN